MYITPKQKSIFRILYYLYTCELLLITRYLLSSVFKIFIFAPGLKELI